MMTCKHNGNLDDRDLLGPTHAFVGSVYDIDQTGSVSGRVYLHGGYGGHDSVSRSIYLDAAQALSLLAWLRQEEGMLKRLAGGGEA
jgi:hypothetical protein